MILTRYPEKKFDPDTGVENVPRETCMSIAQGHATIMALEDLYREELLEREEEEYTLVAAAEAVEANAAAGGRRA